MASAVEVVRAFLEAGQNQDVDRQGELLADDVTFRAAGVPRDLGGVNKGKDVILQQMRSNAPGGTFELREIFGDENNVCVVGKVSAERFPGNQFLRGSDRPYTTFECIVFHVEGGKITEETAYINWLDPYVQTGLVNVKDLAAEKVTSP